MAAKSRLTLLLPHRQRKTKAPTFGTLSAPPLLFGCPHPKIHRPVFLNFTGPNLQHQAAQHKRPSGLAALEKLVANRKAVAIASFPNKKLAGTLGASSSNFQRRMKKMVGRPVPITSCSSRKVMCPF